MLRLFVLVLAWQLTFSAGTDLVIVPVSVLGADGQPVSGLTASNFRLLDEGREQSIVSFAHGDVPVALGLVLDHSVSMRPKRASVLAGLDVFLASSQPRDELFLFDFNDRMELPRFDGDLFTSDPGQLKMALSSGPPVGGTALYDAVREGLGRLAAARADRRALIVVSDGGDNASQTTHDDMVRAARASNAAIYAIGLLDDNEDRRARRILTDLCRESGGTAYFAQSPSDVSRLLTQIGTLLREQYTLGFVPADTPATPEARRLRVTVSSPAHRRLTVQARTFYVPGAAR